MLKKLLLFALFAVPASAQVAPGSGGAYQYAPVTGTGQLGRWITYGNTYVPPSSHTLDWSDAGTAPTACTFQVEGSSDGVHWYAISANAAGTSPVLSCTSGGMFHIAFKPVLLLRINILTYTAGDSTTAVSFNYTRGQ